ncbi:MAG: metal ABC transporter permease [Candidatus Omnitrophica bacterium]|nr:metal ABC transporter permease [Candidatus Omnitrophota bacterium]
MMHWLLEPLGYQFIRTALLASVLIGMTCSVLGVFVVLKRMSNVGHALTHSALPGLVAAYLAGINLFVGALSAVILTALGIGLISENDEVYEDTAIGIVPMAMFSLGILMMSQARSFRDLSSMLFGNILGVGPSEMLLIAVITVIVLGVLALFYKEIELFCVDPNYARTIGVPIANVRFGLLLLLALTVVAGIQAVGTVLTSALLVAPAASARLLTNRLREMVLISLSIAVSAGFCGIYLSYYLGLSSGAAIVFVCSVVFIICWLVKWMRRS